MQNFKLKMIFLVAIFSLILLLGLPVNAANNETQPGIEILITDTGDGIIYIEDHLTKEFQFAFTNIEAADPTTLDFKNSETDLSEEGNHIAYINTEIQNDYFADDTKPVYFWAKDSEGEFIKGIEIDETTEVVFQENIDYIDQLTKIIDTKISSVTTETIENDVKITTTVGKLEIIGEGPFAYQLIKPESEEYKNFIKLAERMSKINSVDAYTELKTYREFIAVYSELLVNLDEESWKEATDNTVYQPEGAENGEQYVVWLVDTSKEEDDITALDVQILTSIREETQEVIKEKVTTRLPVTYDNNTLLIVLGVLVIATIVVLVRIKTLKNKEEK